MSKFKLLILGTFVVVLSMSVSGFGSIVSSNDTLGIEFQPLDSLGNPVDLAADDSLYLAVFYPSGALAHRDSMAFNDARITSVDWEDWTGAQINSAQFIVSDIDGDGRQGVYHYNLLIYDENLALTTRIRGSFNLIDTLFAGKLAAIPNRSDFSDAPTNWSDLAVSTNGAVVAQDTTEGGGSIGTSAWTSDQRDSVLAVITKLRDSLTYLSMFDNTSDQVIVGTNNDKSGYELSASGVSAVQSGLSTFDNTSDQVTVSTNNDKTGYSLSGSQSFSTSGTVGGISGVAFPTNFNLLSIDGNGYVVASQIDGIGFPTNFGLFGIDGSGHVTVGSNNDKTGYSLATSQSFNTSGTVGGISGVTFPGNFGSLLINGLGHVIAANLTLTTDEQDSILQASVKNALYWGVCPGGDCDLRLKYGAGATVPDSGQIIDDNATGADTLVGTIYYEYMDVVVGEDTVTVGSQSGFRKW